MSSPDAFATAFWTRNGLVPGAMHLPLEIVPAICGFWLASALDNVLNWPDQSMHGLSLTAAGGGTPAQSVATSWPGVTVPYLDFANIYYYRNDEAALSITGDMAIGAWVWFDDPTSQQGIVNKWEQTTGNNRSYCLDLTAAGLLRFRVSRDGGNTNMSSATAEQPTAGEWHFCQARHDCGVITAVRLDDGAWATDTSSVPTSIYDSTRQFRIGEAQESSVLRLDGKLALVWLAGYAVPTAVFDYLYAVQGPYFGKV